MNKFITEPTEGYELIDTGNGLRLERVGTHTVVRPDPSVLWPPTSPDHPAWHNPDARFSPDDQGHWKYRRDDLSSGWDATFHGARVLVKPTPFRHIGVFPEQGANWEWLERIIKDADGPVHVLNLFGYTGVASIVAARAGAKVTHVDASKGTVFWASDNARRTGLGEKGIRWIVDDVSKFVAREVRREAHYDIILLDPPVFGRGTKGEVWRLEEDLPRLLEDVSKIFSKEPLGFLLNFYATALYPESVARLVTRTIEPVVGACTVAMLTLRESESKALFQTGYCVRSEKRP